MAKKCPKCQSDNPGTATFCADCGTQLPSFEDIEVTETLEAPKEELTTGSTFAGRYQVIEELGKGGMGKVYKVLDKEVNAKVALKLIKPEVASDKKTIERFRNELKVARDIAHKNVCRMYHLGKEEGAYYITMEYVSGEDLKSFIRRSGIISVGKAISIANQVCEGLLEAHRLGVVHRDLKPQNIMIDKDGNARIMDFGIARSLRAKGITGSGVMIGTPEYMSPEQIDGKETDQRADIYSLGVVLYEMVTGKVPFEGDTPFSIGVKQKSEAPCPPREINEQIPEDLNRVILKCMEKERERRYQTVGDLHVDLTTIERGIPTTEKPILKKVPTPSEEITVTFKKRWAWIAVPFLLLCLAVVVFFVLRGGKQAPAVERKMLVVLPFENLGLPEDEYFADGITEEITNRLSALHGLYVISRTSAVEYKKTEKTIRQIREELDVDYVVTGAVRWDKIEGERGRVLVSPQLISASDDTQIWSENYERSIQDIFEVQAEIAEEITKQLDLTLLEPERQAMYDRPTENLEAYDFFLRAREHSSKAAENLDRNEYSLAIEKFEKAIELDPDFTLAYLLLSNTHSWIYFTYDKSDERRQKSKDAVDKALELEPDMPYAHLILGYYYYRCYLDYERALKEFEYVQKASPNLRPQLLGYIQRRQGKWDESLETLEEAFKINPRDSGLAREIGNSNWHMRRYAETETWYNRSLSIRPRNLNTLGKKGGNAFYWRGSTKEIRSILGTVPQGPSTDMVWIETEMIDGNYDEVLERLNSLSYNTREFQFSYFHKDLAYAEVYHRKKEFSEARTHADLARISLEKSVLEHPEDPRYRAALGLAYALMGRKDEALEEGNQATKLLPISKDTYAGPFYLMDLIKILIVAEEYEEVVDKLDYLMSISAGRVVSVSSLQNDSLYDPLRDNPHFHALVEKYSIKN